MYLRRWLGGRGRVGGWGEGRGRDGVWGGAGIDVVGEIDEEILVSAFGGALAFGLEADPGGFEQRCSWVMADFQIAVVDAPGAVEVLAHVDACLSPAAALGTRRQLKDEVAKCDGVVGSDHAAVAEAEDLVAIDAAEGSEGRARLSGRAAEATVEISDPAGLEKVVGLLESRQAEVGQLGDESVLGDAEEALDPAFALRRAGEDGSDAELAQGIADLGRLLLASELFGEAPVAVVAA